MVAGYIITYNYWCSCWILLCKMDVQERIKEKTHQFQKKMIRAMFMEMGRKPMKLDQENHEKCE